MVSVDDEATQLLGPAVPLEVGVMQGSNRLVLLANAFERPAVGLPVEETTVGGITLHIPVGLGVHDLGSTAHSSGAMAFACVCRHLAPSLLLRYYNDITITQRFSNATMMLMRVKSFSGGPIPRMERRPWLQR